jgi:hypothetical protein
LPQEFNLLGSLPKASRDVAARRESKDENRRLALQFVNFGDGKRIDGNCL